MGERSVSADRRRAVAIAAWAALAVVACTATSPPPLPPRRAFFPMQAEPAPAGSTDDSVPRPLDLPLAAEAPGRDERYLGWTVTADALSIGPLLYWTARPKDFYLAAPALLLVPAIHAAHGELRSAGISLAMRGAMLGLAYLANRWADRQCTSSSASPEGFCLPIGPFLLLDLAIVIPMTIDSSILAQRRRPAPEWDQLPTRF